LTFITNAGNDKVKCSSWSPNCELNIIDFWKM